ncbi:hypothetical protein EHO60_05610 [Leptospira fletcheri]|uniref:Uncharacterized protein n=1 Tax=Leptospira fletcheri TaxID=2484981 RepID=A0A4R9GGS9_9LEPT|nr:hypothetical protein [Leptospira fletcheri]TGK11769.1 hypothetical protein EHO60_05610 [Leptospira fletcheri]
MNTRPTDEIQPEKPELIPSGPDFPHTKKIGKLLDRYAAQLLEQRFEKVISIQERRSLSSDRI